MHTGSQTSSHAGRQANWAGRQAHRLKVDSHAGREEGGNAGSLAGRQAKKLAVTQSGRHQGIYVIGYHLMSINTT